MSDLDPVVQAGCADAAEKASRTNPKLLSRRRRKLLALLASSRQQEVRWHIAQMLLRRPQITWPAAFPRAARLEMIRVACIAAVAVLTVASSGARGAADVTVPSPSPIPYPCNNIYAFVTRPTVSTSPCPVPPHEAVLETGYMNTTTIGMSANSTTGVPQAFIHTGIGPRLEFDFTPPSAESTNNGVTKISGSTDLGFGFKALLGYTARAQYGVGVSMTVPSGSAAYTNGANTYSFIINGSYTLSSNLSPFSTVAFDSRVGTDSSGNLKRFASFVPALGISYTLPSNWYVYGEAMNFSKVAPNSGSQSLLDYGVQKVIGQHVQLDAEVGNALNVVSGSRYHHVGAGASFLFGK